MVTFGERNVNTGRQFQIHLVKILLQLFRFVLIVFEFFGGNEEILEKVDHGLE